MKNIVIAIIASFFMVGCNAGAPECDDGDVKDLVMNIIKQEYYKQMGMKSIDGNNIVMYNGQLVVPIDGDEDDDMAAYKIWQEKYGKKGSEKIIRLQKNSILRSISNTRNAYNNLNNAELRAIRMDSKDEEIKKSSCSAQLDFKNGNIRNISYTAQTTSDNQIYVEVYGL